MSTLVQCFDLFLGDTNYSPLNQTITLPSGDSTVSISIVLELTHRTDTGHFTVSIRGLGSTCVIVENSDIDVPMIVENSDIDVTMIITNNEGMYVCMYV